MEQKTQASQAVAELLPCAFCGSFAVLKEIGNDHTKTRSVQVKCANFECRVERTDKAMARGMEWLRAVAIENWNRRPALKAQPAPTEAAQGDRQVLQAEGKHPAPCARHCEATAFGIEIRRLEAENAQLRGAQGNSNSVEFAGIKTHGEDSARFFIAVKSYRDLQRKIRAAGRPPHSDYWHQSLSEAEAAIDAALASAETGGVKP